MARLPTVSGDGNAWGTILNDFLSVSHNADGTLKKRLVNLGDFCAIDGTTDDSTGFTTAYTLAATLGTGVWHPGGTLVKGNDTILPNVPIYGAGRGLATIKLKNGANVDLFSAHVANINLSGSYGAGPGPTSADCVYGFGFHGLTLDGNRANQSSGTSYVLRFYGYGFVIEDCYIEHGYTGGMLYDYYGPFPDQNTVSTYSGDFEGQITNTKIMYNNGIGVQHGGPSDSQWLNMEVAENGSHNIHNAPNGTGLQATNVHAWFPGQGNTSVSWLCEAAIACTNCEAEGSDTVQLALITTGSGFSWIGGSIFGGGHAGAGLRIGQVGGLTPYNGQVEVSGGLTTYTNPNFYLINTMFSGITNSNGSIWFDHDGIGGNLQSVIYNNGSNPSMTGAVTATNILNISVHDTAGDYNVSANLGEVAQFALLPDGCDLSGGSAATLSTSTIYYVGCTLPAQATLIDFRLYFGAGGAGTWDIGIYADASGVPGAQLYQSTGNPSATGTNTSYINSHVTPLLPAGRYWLALHISNASDTVYCKNGVDALMVVAYTQTASSLPSTAGSLTHSATRPVLIGLLQGEWS